MKGEIKMTIEELNAEIKQREFDNFMYQMADRYTPSERAAKDKNHDELLRLLALRRELEAKS